MELFDLSSELNRANYTIASLKEAVKELKSLNKQLESDLSKTRDMYIELAIDKNADTRVKYLPEG